MITNTTLTGKQAHWLAHIQAADRSGQSLSTYAQTHKLKGSKPDESPRIS
jgi:hypothetical protein